MELQTFRSIVQSYVSGIPTIENELSALYDYVGLPAGNDMSRREVGNALKTRIKSSLTAGHAAAWHQCRDWLEELIQDHVLDGTALDPCFSVLYHLREAMRGDGSSHDVIQGSWIEAIHYACDSVALYDWAPSGEHCESVHSRTFEVARAAKRLKESGYQISRDGPRLGLDDESEDRVVKKLETLTATMGGLNVARRIFQRIVPLYDVVQERYHVVPYPQPTGGGRPQIPFGFLVQLAAKHIAGVKPYKNTDRNWAKLCRLATDYAALFDVQPYVHTVPVPMDPYRITTHLQELALYDTLFRVPQARAKDVLKVVGGLLLPLSRGNTYGTGWTIKEALTVSAAILSACRSHRGPSIISLRQVKKLCRQIAPEIVATIIADVLCHPVTGANQNFSKPTDAPMGSLNGVGGHDFFTRPLLRHNDDSTILLDRSVSAPAFLEALLSPLRAADPASFETKLGRQFEVYLRDELQDHAVPTLSGSYRASEGEGECDLVIEADDTIIFLETKKKVLTRRARSGSDAHILIDLTRSMLDAQLQAGWHEIRIRRDGYLDLKREDVTTRLELKSRQIERIAVSLMDFGSFQDRRQLEIFLSANARAAYTPIDPSLKEVFIDLNESLDVLREQMTILPDPPNQLPFFHCWFLSLPQLLVMLDGVERPADFKRNLWRTRHIVTGTSDWYYDFSRFGVR